MARKKPVANTQSAPGKTAKTKAVARKKARAKPKPKTPAKPTPKTPAKPKPKKPAAPAKQPPKRPSTRRARKATDAGPAAAAPSSGPARTVRERAARSSSVVAILDAPHPIVALRRFLDSHPGALSSQQAQIALGAAQLLPLAREHRGGGEVEELVDLVLSRWEDFGDRRYGFHAEEFLRNALTAIGADRDRIARLAAHVPASASAELLFNLACAHAVARDKDAMLRAVDAALEAGAMSAQFRREAELGPYQQDPDLALRLARADVPHIPVDIEPYLPTVRAALDSLVGTLREFGEHVEMRPPVRLDAILDAERAHKISLPNDYRALLTLTNGMRLWEHEFFGAGDYREATPLAARATRWLETASAQGATGLEECVPLACWGQPTDWLLYDPRGRVRGGDAGYVLMLDTDDRAIDDLAAALAHLEDIAREVLGTN